MKAPPELLTPSCREAYSIGIYMPPYLFALEKAVGVELVRAFLSEFGGHEVNIPVAAQRSGAHCAVFEWLRAEFGVGRVKIAAGPLSHRVRLAWTIRERLARGESASTIARGVGCGERTVFNHKRRLVELGALPITPVISKGKEQ